MEAVRRQPLTLKARASTMRETATTLNQLLGPERARQILIESPTVLQVRTWKLRRNFKYASDRLGVAASRELPVFYWKASMPALTESIDRKLDALEL